MTFEEFFQKKKIDLKALGTERPDLLEEFRMHFAQMGEKSFDHTKKYWFNKLRRSYPLKEIPAAAASPTSSRKPSPATTAPVTTAPKAAASMATASTAAAPETQPPASKPAGFKPRFRPGVTPSQKKDATEKPNAGDSGSRPAETPAESGKKPGNTPEKPENTPAAPPSKPAGFKPRFRPGVTPSQKKDAGK